MTDTHTPTVDTVLGPVPAAELGVVAIHESPLFVLPGAQYAPDITIDRAEIFDTVSAALLAFREAGGGTVVDSTGMFHGRDLSLLEALARTTGVHIVASTGMGPEEMLGGYFLTPQTNPPTPWPAEKFADLFSREVTEGMVVPRVERRGPAGLVTTTVSPAGMTGTDESLLRGSARAALTTGVPMTFRVGADARAELDIVLAEGLGADRVAVAGLDGGESIDTAMVDALLERGAFVLLDHVGATDGVRDEQRTDLVVRLVEAGHADRVLLSAGAVIVGKGVPGTTRAFDALLTGFVPLLRERGLDDTALSRILTTNPAALLARASH